MRNSQPFDTRELLSNDDGSENGAKKRILRPFIFYRLHLDALNLSNVGDFYWSEICKDFIQVQKDGKENSSSYVHVLYKVALGGFMLYSCSAVVSLIKPIVAVVVVVESWSKRNKNTVISMAGCLYAAFQSTS